MNAKQTNFYIHNGELQVHAGSTIQVALEEAKTMASKQGPVSFTLNDIRITVAEDSDVTLLLREFDRRCKRYEETPIEPYPARELASEVLARDEEIEAQNEVRRQNAKAEYEEKQKAKEKALQTRLASAGPIELKDANWWNNQRAVNSGEPYGEAVCRYAEIWARLMQVECQSGKKIAEIAEQCSHEADVDGITGFMYGCAVSMLARCWKHGEALRLWHNKTSQLGTEGDAASDSGGVLNPAMLTVG